VQPFQPEIKTPEMSEEEEEPVPVENPEETAQETE
jgi:hypothetical protein